MQLKKRLLGFFVGRQLVGLLKTTSVLRFVFFAQIARDVLALVPLAALNGREFAEDIAHRLVEPLRAVDDAEYPAVERETVANEALEEPLDSLCVLGRRFNESGGGSCARPP